MLRSLYFKLNDENPKHKEIIEFFNNEKEDGESKIDLLLTLIHLYYNFL